MKSKFFYGISRTVINWASLDVRIPFANVLEVQIVEKDVFLVLFEKGLTAPPHPYEIEKNVDTNYPLE